MNISDIEKWCSIEFADSQSNPISYSDEYDGEIEYDGYLYLNGEPVTDLDVLDGVESIGDYAFRGYYLEGDTIPESVTSIGNFALSSCNDSIRLSDKITYIAGGAFRGAENISIDAHNPKYTAENGIIYSKDMTELVSYPTYDADFEIADSVTKIGDYAFADCYFESIDIPEGITSIGEGAFLDCSVESKNITIPESVTSIGDYAFSGVYIEDYEEEGLYVTILGSIEAMGIGVFEDCEPLQNVVIEEGLESISDYTFSGCTALESFIIPDSVTSIGDYAFYNCERLDDIVIPYGVTSIGEGAFKCYRVDDFDKNSITIPSSVTSIGSDAFADISFQKVHISDIEKWCSIEFADNGSNPISYSDEYDGEIEYDGYLYLNGEPVTNLVIPDGVESIGNYAFCGYGKLESVTIPYGVTSIGNYAFEGCDLESIAIPNRDCDKIGLNQ